MGLVASPSFTVRTDVSNGVARLALAGELDMLYAPELQERVGRAIDGSANAALLDLRDLTFMDAAGLRVLLWASERARQTGHRMAIVGVGGEPRRVLQISETADALVDEAEGMELIRLFTSSDGMDADAEWKLGDSGDG